MGHKQYRVGRFTSFLLRRKAWLEVELSLQERRIGRKNSFLNGKEGRVGFRKNNTIMMKNFKDITVAVADTGYVGLSIATLLSQHHHVTAVDVIPEKV